MNAAVVVAVAADFMAAGGDVADEVRMAEGNLANHKERRLDPISGQKVQQSPGAVGHPPGINRFLLYGWTGPIERGGRFNAVMLFDIEGEADGGRWRSLNNRFGNEVRHDPQSPFVR